MDAINNKETDVKPQLGQIVRIVIKDIEQLFNSFDASPFIEKDLDDDAEEYIVSSFNEFPLKTRVNILIQMPSSQKGKFDEQNIKESIKHYFIYKNELEEDKIDLQIREGQKSLGIGLSFLTICLLTREYLLTLDSNFVWHMLSEALMIFGWVAMWKPISNVLYDWWPMKQKERIYEKISKSEIDFVYG